MNRVLKRVVLFVLLYQFFSFTRSPFLAYGAPQALSASVDEYSQCSNDDGDGYATNDIGCRWTNGNLNINNSVYHEGDATVQRLAIKDLTNGEHTVTIQYDSLKGGKHAYDFLTDDNFSELTPNVLTDSDLCDPSLSNFDSCATTDPGGVISGVIPAAPNANGFDVASGNNRHFKIRNGSWSNTGTIVPGIVSNPTVLAGADAPTNIQLKFYVDTNTCADKYQVQGNDVCEVLITWGAHISTQADWGEGNSAVDISGSPYHVRVVELDGNAVGNRDNQMQASAIVIPQQATLTLVKTVTNDNGGNAVPTDWTLSASGPTSISGTTGDPAVTNALVDAGSYSLSESTGISGYEASVYSCVINGGAPVLGDSVDLAPGDLAICTINNDDQAAQLIVIKEVENGNTGATYASSDFTMTINGVTASGGNSFPGEEFLGTSKTLTTVGSYSVTETGPSGYDASFSADCEGVIALGETKTCTITNTAIAPQLKLVKTVINDNGGTKQVSDFDLNVDGNPVISGEYNPMTVGEHTASETGVFGYTASDWGSDCAADGAVSLALGESKTCTITNDDIQPKLTVIKHVINDDGGTAVVSDFPLFVDVTGVVSGATNGFDAGFYTVSETQKAGYAASEWSGDCLADGTITLSVGDDKTCEITNDDIAPTLKLEKVVVNDNGGTSVPADWDLTADGSVLGFSDVGDSVMFHKIKANTDYSLSESSIPGYAMSSWSCTGGGNLVDSVVTVGLDEHVTCTITNDDIAPSLTLVKEVINDHGGTAEEADFTLTATGPTGFSGVGPSVSNAESFDAGTYVLSESTMEGYTGSDWICTGEGVQNGNEITLGLGNSASCTITNDDEPGTLIVKKVVINDNGGTLQSEDFSFIVNGSDPENFEADGQNDKTVDAGTYSVVEPTVNGYETTYDNCSDLVIPNGGTATCTITNNDIAAKLTIVKDAQPNDLTDFTFTRNFGANFQLDDDENVLGADNTLSNTAIFMNLSQGLYSVSETLPNSFWQLESVSCVESGNNAPFVQVNSATGVEVNLGLADDVTCTFVNTKESPTRTLGFWQTHTSYTSNVFTNVLLSNMPIGIEPHKGSITSTAQLFGAFYASISKTTTGAKRSALDQARMQLLQQLVAAKLNCAAFGCQTSIQVLISQADTAYAGTNKSAILAVAGLLDAFNNSGDTIILSGNPGNATPMISKNLANLSFWNAP